MKMEAEIGVIHPRTQECQGLLATPAAGRDREEFFPLAFSMSKGCYGIFKKIIQLPNWKQHKYLPTD